MKEALFYQTENQTVVCGLCAHRCRIKPGRRGICGVRENQDGTLYSLAYGRISAEHVDPVEKKPLYHFLPGSLTCSIATVGCNFKCLHCQNYSLSQAGAQIGRAAYHQRKPEEIVDLAQQQGCRSISYTYSEPTIFIEFALDCARLSRERGLKNIFVSNGYMTRKAAEVLSSILDGINIDIKSFSESFYLQTCGGGLQQVLDNVRFFFQRGVWVEVTTLVIPGLNDSDEELRSIARFIASCDPAMPWHVSAFRPTFKMTDRPPTSAESLLRARQVGFDAGLHHVYVGNIVGGGGEDTRCPGCGETVIRRHGFSIRQNLLSRNRCPFCSAAISGVW
jgi:pyruvate formate lyase activating enzyme